MDSLETDSVRSAPDTRNLLTLSQRNRQHKNKVACGVFGLICIAGITIGFGFLFVQRSEFIQEKIHTSDADAVRQIGSGPVAQAQQASFDLPTYNRESRSTANNVNQPGANQSRSGSIDTGEPASTTTHVSLNSTRTKQLPADAQSRHPVSLLYEMKLHPVFERFNCPNAALRHPLFKMVLSFSGKPETFKGYGKKIKIAKKLAAQQACTALYNLTYSEDPDLYDEETCGV